MPKAILVPLDGSTFAEHALPVAIDLARRTGSRLHLVQVHEQPAFPVDPNGLIAEYAEWEHAMMLREEEYLRATANRCMETAGLAARTELLEGPPANALATYANELESGMVVMTTHGRGGISRAWVGSVADALVRRCRVPVLLLRPPTTAGNGRDALLPRHVLIPTDGSALSERIIEPALALGTLGGARYTLLRVALPVPLVPVGSTPGRQRELAERERMQAVHQLDAVARPLRARGIDVETVVVHDSLPATAILEFAAENAVDMIALATRGRGGWSRVALGSVADKVMRGSLLPVLLYRPPVPEAANGAEAMAGAKRAGSIAFV
jgi:nucleotide-binding universal stress UspA family protein